MMETRMKKSVLLPVTKTCFHLSNLLAAERYTQPTHAHTNGADFLSMRHGTAWIGKSWNAGRLYRNRLLGQHWNGERAHRLWNIGMNGLGWRILQSNGLWKSEYLRLVFFCG